MVRVDGQVQTWTYEAVSPLLGCPAVNADTISMSGLPHDPLD